MQVNDGFVCYRYRRYHRKMSWCPRDTCAWICYCLVTPCHIGCCVLVVVFVRLFHHTSVQCSACWTADAMQYCQGNSRPWFCLQGFHCEAQHQSAAKTVSRLSLVSCSLQLWMTRQMCVFHYFTGLDLSLTCSSLAFVIQLKSLHHIIVKVSLGVYR